MTDAEGSSTAALGAQTEPGSTQRGLLSRLGLWTSPRSNEDEQDVHAEQSDVVVSPSVSNLKRMRIEDVAIPKGEIIAVPVEITLDELLEVFRESGFTRVPVFEGTLDMPLGLIHLKDVALKHGFNGGGNGFEIRDMLRPLLFAPPSMTIGVLLQKMQTERRHMALVIDEYGGTDGLVTIEDLIEQVIGEIEDEHDVDEDQPWTEEAPGCYMALARTPLDEFGAATGLDLTLDEYDEEADTIGGVVFLITGRVPARGEIIKHPNGIEILVLDADPRRIKRLRVQKPENSDNEG